MSFRPTTIGGRAKVPANFDRPRNVARQAKFAVVNSRCRFLVPCVQGLE
jgi:hypothetical protein